MSRSLKILLLVVCMLAGFRSMAQTTKSRELVVFSDRDFCISGDTLWINVFVPEALHSYGTIVHLQLESQHRKLIASAAIKRNGTHAEGYIAVPDSLQTGLYFAHAFLNARRNNERLDCIGRTLYVYNRFEEEIDRLPVVERKDVFLPTETNNRIVISVNNSAYNTRNEVSGVIDVPEEEFVYAVVSAQMVDPFANANTGFINFKMENVNKQIPAFAEEDGIVISGQISDKETGKPANELVLLSVVGNESYFDYYYPDSTGSFHFFMQDAQGKADLILQPLSAGQKMFDLKLTPNFLSGTQQLTFDTAFVNPVESESIQNSIKGTFFNKLFGGVSLSRTDTFEMPNPYGMPFYGWPDNHVVPDEFFDLPDFKEISRELLMGVQYRERNGEVTFRLINYGLEKFFANEPLRLINGIPVFKNSYFQSLKSTDIASIDIIKSERVFGDLRFNGVLAVSLNDKSNNWLAQQPNIFQVKVPCIEFPKQANYSMSATGKNVPDTREQFYNEVLKTDKEQSFNFKLSDVKGELEIKVEAISKSGKLYKTSKIISVQ
ncbi:hypothetical protein [uncultured Draconibacterium sp.]|uniref:hypothetical protein n=1 Tax=uncultured Draconibacterium sp. TaxID=1573823 RepID=UPI002AA65D38|nr:hypothetical protein [uncultured Draconibacterium sp.]